MFLLSWPLLMVLAPSSQQRVDELPVKEDRDFRAIIYRGVMAIFFGGSNV